MTNLEPCPSCQTPCERCGGTGLVDREAERAQLQAHLEASKVFMKRVYERVELYRKLQGPGAFGDWLDEIQTAIEDLAIEDEGKE